VGSGDVSASGAAIETLLGTPQGRRALSKASPEFFDTYYCGMRKAPHRTKWLRIIEDLRKSARRSGKKQRVLMLAPRDHGKTEAGITIATRAICQDRNIRILWISEAKLAAKKRMSRISALLTSGRVQQDWCKAPGDRAGPFVADKDQKWNEDMIYVDRDKVSVDPTIEAVGSGGGVTGGHFDLIIGDDLEDERTTYTENERAKTRNWFYATVGPMLSPGGLMIIIGTRKHHDDLYAHLLKNASWRIFQDPAILQWPESYDFVTEADEHGREVIIDVTVTGESKVLWPEERPIDYLLKERMASTARAFAREFQHMVQDDADAMFQWEWLQRAKERGRDLSYYHVPRTRGRVDVVQGWDLALVTDAKRAERKDRDYTVGMTLVKTQEGHRFLVGLIRARGLTHGQLRAVVTKEYDRVVRIGLKPREVVVERNNFGELHFVGLQQTTDLPLVPHLTTGRNKADPWEGIPALSYLFETDKITLPYGDADSREVTDKLVSELFGFGVEAHDDQVMALWITETRLRQGVFQHQISLDSTTIMSLDTLPDRVHDMGVDPEHDDPEDDEDESIGLDEVLARMGLV